MVGFRSRAKLNLRLGSQFVKRRPVFRHRLLALLAEAVRVAVAEEQGELAQHLFFGGQIVAVGSI
jgi:hypothetical protein